MGRGTSPQPQKRKPVMGKKKRRGNRTGVCLEDRPLLESYAAAIDIGAREIFVAVPPGRDENPVSDRRSLTNGNVSGGRNRFFRYLEKLVSSKAFAFN